ncbi:hypothetical protein HPP92_028024 [Vanilla planifolia]|uniref:Uncharacterized protein n=1 Tax=Vanilla planifolia TaxID=51239 RepID=A0A835PAA2_VANPL|nr:hypothetical protein HPP92_028024 [Vanilla planifolia]
MWRFGAKLAIRAGLFGGGLGAVAVSNSDDLSTAFKICTHVPVRLLRDSLTAAAIVIDYEYSVWGLSEGSFEWLKAQHEAHNRCAQRMQELCFRNGGNLYQAWPAYWAAGVCYSSRICAYYEGINAEKLSIFLI